MYRIGVAAYKNDKKNNLNWIYNFFYILYYEFNSAVTNKERKNFFRNTIYFNGITCIYRN